MNTFMRILHKKQAFACVAGVLVFCLFGAGAIFPDEPTDNQDGKNVRKPPYTAERIAELIRNLDNENFQERESATHELVLAGKTAEPLLSKAMTENPGGESLLRIKRILTAIPVKERTAFSDGLLEWYPDIYLKLAEADFWDKFEILHKVTMIDYNWNLMNFSTESDAAGIIGEILLNNREDLTTELTTELCRTCSGNPYSRSETRSQLRLRWYKKMPSAVPHIKSLLNDPEQSIRITAISTLGNMEAKDAIKDLILLLKDDDYEIRRSVAEALIDINIKDAWQDTARILESDDIDACGRAIYILANCGVKDALDRVIPFLYCSDSKTREAAIYAAGKLGTPDTARDIIPFLKDDNTNISVKAVYALVDLKAASAAKDIADLLKSNDSDVLAAAARALGKLKAKEFSGEIAMLLDEEDRSLTMVVLEALASLEAKESASAVILLLKNDALRNYALQSLTALATEKNTRELVPFLKDPDSRTRERILDILGIIGATDARNDIKPLLKDEDSEVRKKAYEVLVKFEKIRDGRN